MLNQRAKATQVAAATKIQRTYRSYARKKLHESIFKIPPHDQIDPLAGLDQRIKQLVLKAASYHAVINNKVYHWTTLSNFRKIIQHGALYGNKYLSSKAISFQKNALSEADVNNGDGNIICLCPYLVDPIALINSKYEIREGLLRLTIDLEKIKNLGKYNQFFKLQDILSPGYKFGLKINDKVSVHFIKLISQCGHYYVKNMVLSLEGSPTQHNVFNRENILHYGNLYSINRFCMSKFFEIIDAITEPDLKSAWQIYLKNLSDDEVTKLLVGFAQALTFFAEYNFNAVLPITSNMISEIYHVSSGRHYQSQYTDPEELQSLIDKIENETETETHPDQSILIADPNKKDYFMLYNNSFFKTGRNMNLTHDITKLPADLFSKNQYVETRKGMNKI